MKKDLDKIETFFDEISDDFDSIYSIKKAKRIWYSKIFDKIFRKSIYLRYINTFKILEPVKNKKIIDMGCGSGIYSIELARKGAYVTGIDISDKMIEIANMRLNKEKLHDKCDFIKTDIFKFNSGSKYDYCIAMGLFDYIKNPVELLNRMKKVTSGKILFSCPIKYDILALQRKIRYFLKNCPLYFYTEKKIREIMKQCNIKNYNIEKLERDYFVSISFERSSPGTSSSLNI